MCSIKVSSYALLIMDQWLISGSILQLKNWDTKVKVQHVQMKKTVSRIKMQKLKILWWMDLYAHMNRNHNVFYISTHYPMKIWSQPNFAGI
jgi:hypothetical protein